MIKFLIILSRFQLLATLNNSLLFRDNTRNLGYLLSLDNAQNLYISYYFEVT